MSVGPNFTDFGRIDNNFNLNAGNNGNNANNSIINGPTNGAANSGLVGNGNFNMLQPTNGQVQKAATGWGDNIYVISLIIILVIVALIVVYYVYIRNKNETPVRQNMANNRVPPDTGEVQHLPSGVSLNTASGVNPTAGTTAQNSKNSTTVNKGNSESQTKPPTGSSKNVNGSKPAGNSAKIVEIDEDEQIETKNNSEKNDESNKDNVGPAGKGDFPYDDLNKIQQILSSV